MAELYADPARELYNLMKGIASMMVERSEPMRIVYGVVKSVDPLLVSYMPKLTLDENILIIPDYISKSLCVGDSLILLKKDGGQRFLVIGKDMYQFPKNQNFENQNSEYIDYKPNPWYNKNNTTNTGSYWVAKNLLGKDVQSERKNYQPDFAVYGEDRGLLFSEYPYHIPYGQYHITGELEEDLEYGDKVFVSWKGSTPVVMNRVIDTEKVFEEDEEDNEYMVKLKTDDSEVILEKCVQKDNKVYVSLSEILDAYDKLDNDNLSTETEEVPFYSYGFVYNILKVKRSIMGSDVSLDFVVPKAEGGANTTMSYNSLLGSKEIVNIPILWIDGEIYALIDGIYSAMEELILKPRVTGNMDKIPYCFTSELMTYEDFSVTETDDVYVKDINGQDRIYFDKVIYSPFGMNIFLDELFEKFGGEFDNNAEINSLIFTHKDNIYKVIVKTLENKNRVINRNYDVEIYSLGENYSLIDLLSVSIIPNGEPLVRNYGLTSLSYKTVQVSKAVYSSPIVIRTFIDRITQLSNGERNGAITHTDNRTTGTVIVVEYKREKEVKRAVFYACIYEYENIDKVMDGLRSIAQKKKEAHIASSVNMVHKYEDGSMYVSKDLLASTLGINKNVIHHLPGDEFSSFTTAFEMFKLYYDKDGASAKYPGKILATAIYKYMVGNEERYTYSDRVPYDSLLNQHCMNKNTDRTKPFYLYVITSVLNADQIMEVRKRYKYTFITLYYMTSSNSFSILKPYLVTSEELIAVGWNREVVTDEMIDELNRVLYEYDIIDINSVRHFIAQCSHESDDWNKPGYGDGLIEIGEDEYLQNKKYWPYIGAGYIHLTWEYNYKKFSEYLKQEKGIDDPLILSKGPERIASTYAWEAAGYFWSILTNANKVASAPDVHPDKVSVIVNEYDKNSFPTRADIYYKKVVPNIKEKK